MLVILLLISYFFGAEFHDISHRDDGEKVSSGQDPGVAAGVPTRKAIGLLTRVTHAPLQGMRVGHAPLHRVRLRHAPLVIVANPLSLG
jgi:hypothetical protein